MKKTTTLLLFILILAGIYWFFFKSKTAIKPAEKVAPMALKIHSDSFNLSIAKVMESYLSIKDAFVDGDTVSIKSNTQQIILALNQIDTAELKKDTALIFETVSATINDVRSNALSLLQQTDITEMRRDFSSLSDMMFPTFFTAIQYEGPTLYLQNCSMAFNDEVPANWISKSRDIVNPYLGKNHPKFKSAMLHCGEIKDSITAK